MEVDTVFRHFTIRGEQAGMEHIVEAFLGPLWGNGELIDDGGDHFGDDEWAITFGGKFSTRVSHG